MNTILTRLSTGGLMDKLPDKKKCMDCGDVKSLSEFKKNNKMKDGRLTRCHKCEYKRKIQNGKVSDDYAKTYFVHGNPF